MFCNTRNKFLRNKNLSEYLPIFFLKNLSGSSIELFGRGYCSFSLLRIDNHAKLKSHNVCARAGARIESVRTRIESVSGPILRIT